MLVARAHKYQLTTCAWKLSKHLNQVWKLLFYIVFWVLYRCHGRSRFFAVLITRYLELFAIRCSYLISSEHMRWPHPKLIHKFVHSSGWKKVDDTQQKHSERNWVSFELYWLLSVVHSCHCFCLGSFLMSYLPIWNIYLSIPSKKKLKSKFAWKQSKKVKAKAKCWQ